MGYDPVKVLTLAPVHRAWGNRVIREGESLVKAGYHVSAIMRAQDPHTHRGIQIIPAPRYRNRLGRFLKIPAVFFKALRYRADIYHAHNPDMIPVALLLRLCGKTVIYDTHEDYRRRLEIRTWIPAPIRPLLASVISRAEVYVSKRVQRTFVTQPQMISDFSPKTRLLRNAPKVNACHLQAVEDKQSSITRGAEHRLVYIGVISHSRGLSNMLATLVELNKDSSVRLWLAGQTTDDAIVEAQKHPGWKYVDYLDLLTHEEALAYAMRADIGLALIKDIGDHRDARPTKLFEYMSVGTPFIASDFPSWKKVAGKDDLGWWIAPENTERLVEVLQDILPDKALLDAQGQKGRDYVKTFNWELESQILLESYQELAPPRAAALS